RQAGGRHKVDATAEGLVAADGVEERMPGESAGARQGPQDWKTQVPASRWPGVVKEPGDLPARAASSRPGPNGVDRLDDVKSIQGVAASAKDDERGGHGRAPSGTTVHAVSSRNCRSTQSFSSPPTVLYNAT